MGRLFLLYFGLSLIMKLFDEQTHLLGSGIWRTVFGTEVPEV